MAKDEVKRVNAVTLNKDRDALLAVKTMQDYKPSNAAFTLEKILALEADMIRKQEHETLAANEHRSARDAANDAEWAFHNSILGTKAQVIAQYDVNSDEVQAMGLKKKREYNRPSHKKGS